MEDNSPIQDDTPLTIDRAIANLHSDDLGLRSYAAWWLGKFRVKEPEAVARLIVALKDEDDRTKEGGYPLRRVAARSLGKLENLSAVPALIECLNCPDIYVREAAAQALDALGDPQCVPALIALLEPTVRDGSLRVDKEDFSQPYDAIIEALGTLRVTEAVPLIQPFTEHGIPRVRFAALRSMYQLTLDASYGDRLVESLSHPDLQVRRSLLADLGAIGYLPAAEPISQTHAENSLKLIALKGLLEAQIAQSPFDRLSDGAVRVMELMDDLL